jgi:hypothetical protein
MSSSSSEVVIGLTANGSISQMPNNATSIGSSAGSVICQLPNNAKSIGANSLSSNTQMSFSGEGPVGVTGPTFYVTGVTGPKSETIEETTVILEEHLVNPRRCFNWC